MLLTAAFPHFLVDSDFGSTPDTDVLPLISLPYLKKGAFSLCDPLSESAWRLE